MIDETAKARSKNELISVLRETESMLRKPDNDFVWSAWNGPEEAISGIESHITSIESGDFSRLSRLSLLYAPTGRIQEVSVSSGWGDAFLVLAERFDAALDWVKAATA